MHHQCLQGFHDSRFQIHKYCFERLARHPLPSSSNFFSQTKVKDEYTCDKCKVQKAYSNMWETIKNDVLEDLREMKKVTKL